MENTPEDRLSTPEPQGGVPRPVIIIAAVLVLAGIAWLVMRDDAPAPETAEPEPVVEEPVAATAPPEPLTPAAPDIPPAPEPPPATPPENIIEEPAPPPLTLADSDPQVQELLQQAEAPPLYEQALEAGSLLERSAALVSGAHRGFLVDQAMPVPPPQGRFKAEQAGEYYYVDPASYNRFNAYVTAAEAVEPAAVVNAFQRFRPLLEEAYAGLGFPAEDFDNALIASLDMVLATPVIRTPQALERDVVTYHYVDESLENLPPLQKHLMRMGPDNLERLQAVVAEWRAALLAE